jgi:hypothetical protein
MRQVGHSVNGEKMGSSGICLDGKVTGAWDGGVPRQSCMIRTILDVGSSLGNMAAADADGGLNFQSHRGQRSEDRRDMFSTIFTIFTTFTNC